MVTQAATAGKVIAEMRSPDPAMPVEPIWENGATLVLDTEPAYSGHLLDFPSPVPTTLQVFVDGFWYIYKLDSREKEEADENLNSAPVDKAP